MATVDDNPNPNPEDDGKGADYYKSEAQKAFKDRDAAKKALRALEESGRILNEDQLARFKALEDAAAQAEEDKKKKAGEWDTLRETLTKKHANDIAEREAKLKAADEKWQRTMIGLAFAGATDVFGKDALTIYSAKAAERIFGDHVSIDEHGTATVKDRDGNVILDAETGKPASFSAAMRELIQSLPDKADHLRGSGKSGSGNSGGSTTLLNAADVTELTKRAQQGDKDAIAALKRRTAASGGLVMGSALSR